MYQMYVCLSLYCQLITSSQRRKFKRWSECQKCQPSSSLVYWIALGCAVRHTPRIIPWTTRDSPSHKVLHSDWPRQTLDKQRKGTDPLLFYAVSGVKGQLCFRSQRTPAAQAYNSGFRLFPFCLQMFAFLFKN